MDWVLLTYTLIFGVIALYLVSLWTRARRVKDELKTRR